MQYYILELLYNMSDVYVVYQVKTTDMKNVFKFATAVNTLTSISQSDLKYYINMDSSGGYPDTYIINVSNSMCDYTFQTNGATDTSYKNTTYQTNSSNSTYDSTKMLLKHDYLRYLSDKLFGSRFGLGFINNTIELQEEISSKSQDVWIDSIKPTLDVISTSGTHADLTISASGNYMTNSNTTEDNIGREIINSILVNASDRFTDLNPTEDATLRISIPFLDGDTIQFVSTIIANQDQHLLTGGNVSIPSRNYKMVLRMVSDSDFTTNANIEPIDLNASGISSSYNDKYVH